MSIDKKTGNTAKPALKVMQAGERLFTEGDLAKSLFLIQKGQFRLFKPKGGGFIELAVLRQGEVIGEMAYFNNEGEGGRRSCSAEALVGSEVVVISFDVFSKTLGSLNPWFKTIVTTLAKRLEQANTRIKQSESNSVGYGADSKNYKFITENDLIKVLSTLFLIFSSHGKKNDKDEFVVNKKVISLYCKDIYSIHEAKIFGVLQILQSLNYIGIANDESNMPNLYSVKDIGTLKTFFSFFNAEKFLTDDKKLVIGTKCKIFIEEIFVNIQNKKIKLEKAGPDNMKNCQLINIKEIMDNFSYRNIHIGIEDLDDAKKAGIVGDTFIVDSNCMNLEVRFEKLCKLLPIIRFLDDLNKLNKSKR